jgi:hypothetical protein
VELPHSSGWHPTGGVPGCACGHDTPSHFPARGVCVPCSPSAPRSKSPYPNPSFPRFRACFPPCDRLSGVHRACRTPLLYMWRLNTNYRRCAQASTARPRKHSESRRSQTRPRYSTTTPCAVPPGRTTRARPHTLRRWRRYTSYMPSAQETKQYCDGALSPLDVHSFHYARATVRSPRKLNHGLTR